MSMGTAASFYACDGYSATADATPRNAAPLELRYPHCDKFSINYTER